MKVGSLFAGIGGFDLACERAGMQCAWQVEIDPFCQRVLAHHWPDVPRYEDVRTVGKAELEPVDLVCGGFPCQDLSVAGRRAGLAGERSGLFHEFMRIVAELAPRWVLLENVPGLLSSNGGRDMGTVLWHLSELGYGWAYRVLDAQYFGVAQRRRRVFIVGHVGNSGCAAEILFEPESCSGDSPPRRKAGQDIAYTIAAGAGGSKFGSGRDGQDTFVAGALAATLNSGGNNGGFRTEPGEHLVCVTESTMAFTERSRPQGRTFEAQAESAYALTNPGSGGRTDRGQIAGAFGVRRLLPVECERLQGFPDGWTAVDGEKTSDSSRYRALGNAVAVPVAEWIVRRLLATDRRLRGDAS